GACHLQIEESAATYARPQSSLTPHLKEKSRRGCRRLFAVGISLGVRRSSFRETHERFEFVSARFAFLQMLDAAFAHLFRPGRHQHGLTALGTRIGEWHRSVTESLVGSQFHEASLGDHRTPSAVPTIPRSAE